MAGISDKALKGNYTENKYRYNKGSELQSKEFSDGFGLETYETQLRELDPQLGRWWQVDSKIDKGYENVSPYNAMNNDPARFNDPSGDEGEEANSCCLIEIAKVLLNLEGNKFQEQLHQTGEGIRKATVSAGSTLNGMMNTATAGAWPTDPAGKFGINSETNPSATNLGQLGGIFFPNPIHTAPGMAFAPIDGVSLGPTATPFLPALPSARADASSNSQSTKSPNELGKEGMEGAGITQNTQRIPSPIGTANYRVPDGLTNTTISEVKNVSRLSLTNQIKDFISHAQNNGMQFSLYVRPGEGTKLSNPLVEQIKNGFINLQTIK